MMRRFALLAVGAAAGALVAGTAAQFGGSGEATAAAPDTYRQLNLFGDVFERIRADYVEEPDDAKLIESAVNGMLSSLDPHSSFLNAKDYQDMQVQTRGEFFGLGIEVTMENELIKVISPIDDTPAAKAGILAGDVITQLDGEQVRGLTLRDAVEKMRGPANSSIVLTIIREGAPEPLKITVVRDVIRVQSSSIVSRTTSATSASLRSASRRWRAWRRLSSRIEAEIPADPAEGLCARSARESRGPARSGSAGIRCLP
jgi:carboxyl-terminal processing protease